MNTTQIMIPSATPECFEVVSLKAPKAVDTAFFDQYVFDVMYHDNWKEALKEAEQKPVVIKPGVYDLDAFLNAH